MTVYFGMLDGLLAAEELPEEYRNRCQDMNERVSMQAKTALLYLNYAFYEYADRSADEDVDEDEVEPLPGAISFWRLFNFVDGLDWALMAAGTVAAAAHDAAFVVYMH
ncbi:unnamed protein product [Triticum turgidum subsp. durum]|uniref:Uncharacterized protein n=1 Tax=Triticum turgidum subsp. durum TaxID=4567 RepID=A0A9R0RFB0_TRITD|nr:unnamed protein product [Triticum turgidum subsp. durum]